MARPNYRELRFLFLGRRWQFLWLAGLTLVVSGQVVVNADDKIEFFENKIRPLLVEKCSRCHSAKKQSGGLRIDSREAVMKGGDGGSAVLPGDPTNSLVVRAVRRKGDLKMPPDNPLSAQEIRSLEKWIELGAPWPESAKTLPSLMAYKASNHWAFQPVEKPPIPEVGNADRVRSPIDAFVLARLQEAGLTPSPAADQRTLIRRAYYALTGLPPSPEEVEQFVKDPDPKAFELLVDRLLDSPHYGEQWARHWLDIARYSDTKGYVYAREERFWVHAWTYRDWVVRALNDDLPYDRFLLLQLAADQVEDREQRDLAAMGFLTLGRRFLGVKHLITDDRIDVVTRGALGLTVGCARCHDHKYDPIPTADYYSLYGVFDSCKERMVSLSDTTLGDKAYQKELQKRKDSLQSKLAACRAESSARVRARVADYLHAQTGLHKYPADGFDQVFQKTDLLPSFVRRWESYLQLAARRRDPVFVAWHAYLGLAEESFAQQAAEVTRQLQQTPTGKINPIVVRAFSESPTTFRDVVDRYGKIFAQVDASWKAKLAKATQEKKVPPAELPDYAAEQLRQVLYGASAPCEVPDEPIVHAETFFDSASCTELWKLQGEVDRWVIRSNVHAPYALSLVDRPVSAQARIFLRGDPIKKGSEVPRQFLSVLAGKDRVPFQQGSGRLELAQAIIDSANPLTARVIVNRVWAHHFGQGLVPTPSDFGTRSDPPSHPQLLDWLTTRFIEDGWSLKRLHRMILLSSAFRQASATPANSEMRVQALKIDPDNRLLWRMNRRRLTFEETRDSLLAASSDLDVRLGGKPVELFKQPYPKRRTLYGLVDRQFLPGTLRMFDFANPDLHIAQRSETTVPQQALFFMNHPLVLERARALAKKIESKPNADEKVRELFGRVFQREPSEVELAESLDLVDAADDIESPVPSKTAADWKYGYGTLDEAVKQVKGFTPLPHFTGAAWQGGLKWPDAKLGWVQLTATGGHPGNDREHAAIRRWTAPRPMTIEIRSKLVHEAVPGDGIRAFIVSSRAGLLQSTKIHQKAFDLNVASLAVKTGETIDFLVDIGDVLNSDQYLWDATISETAETNHGVIWHSKRDFPKDTVNQLSPWEQLAHVLLCTNEFLFVD